MEKTVNIFSLFEQIANDNPKAFQLFFDHVYSMLYRYAKYFIDDDDLCKDVVADVYIYIWQNRKKLPDIRNYKNYLFICVRNQALNYLKQINKYQKIKLDQFDAISISDKATPEQVYLDGELKNLIELTINLLPQRCRLIFFMVREEGLKYKEVAEILSISDRTVHAQMCIALKRIGTVVKEYHYDKRCR
ncbi:MAG: RNA polymerase sigma-70 factor [Dysgonamonadaceae bacterium]|nr:RNA polymerase sigma-70 factor [Dysgonamonadaceae bacterium]